MSSPPLTESFRAFAPSSGEAVDDAVFWNKARRSPAPSRFRGFGTPLFFLAIIVGIGSLGVAALRFGDPDHWDQPAPSEHIATRAAALASANALAATSEPAPPAEAVTAPPPPQAMKKPVARAKR